MQDGTVKIIINSSAAAKEENGDLKAFMDYMNGEKTEHPFLQEIDREVTAVKENDVYRAEFFSWTAKAMDLKRAGRKEGYQQGMKKGLKQGLEQGIQQGIQQGMQQGVQQGILQNRADSISKMTDYFCAQDPGLTKEQAREMAENILR